MLIENNKPKTKGIAFKKRNELLKFRYQISIGTIIFYSIHNKKINNQ